MSVDLLMLRLCEKYHAFWNPETHRATVRHWLIYLRNEFNFSGVHGAMNRSGSLAKLT